MGRLYEDLSESGKELVQTHASWVWLDEANAWKVKKPVDFGFLDYSTVEKRHAACEAEVRLNARLAKDVYLGVVPVTQGADGRHSFGGEGTTVDWAVKMVRLPDHDRADVRIGEGRLSLLDVDRIAEHLARFHASLPPSREVSGYGHPDVIRRNVQENFDQTRETLGSYLSPEQARELEEMQLGFLDAKSALFSDRIDAGRIRDGHGDLRLEHVYLRLEEAPTIVDCIEFNDRFRYADVASDVAFLSMDLVQFGRADLAERLLATYAREANDYDLYSVVDFYEGYRATVRGKVASFLVADTKAGEGARSRAEGAARRYFLLALLEGRKRLLEPAVIAVGGLIASGKSTVAAQIADFTNAPVVEADRTRKALTGVSPTTHLDDPAWSGAYAKETTERVYAEVFRRAECVLASGRPVVLDASFRSRAHRAAARELARRHGVRFHFVECRVPIAEARRRLETRREREVVSDGRLEIFDAFVAGWEPVTELEATEHVVLDTTVPIESNVASLRGALPAWPTGF